MQLLSHMILPIKNPLKMQAISGIMRLEIIAQMILRLC
jgi:hypothetical protein